MKTRSISTQKGSKAASGILTTLILILTILALSGCTSVDVIKKYSQTSFDDIIESSPDLITDSTKDNHYFNLSVDGMTTLHISNDYNETGKNDLVLSTPIQPFIDAGLDTSKLAAMYQYDDITLSVNTDFGNGNGERNDVQKALFESVAYDRKSLSYHEELDHYGIKLNGGKFEYAKDFTKNDKDIVFVLAAQPFVDAGVDVNSIDGWIFKTMPEPDGSTIDVLLKPFDL